MILYLMRHAESVNPSEWRGSDADRPLSKTGVARLEKAVQEMKRAGFSYAGLLTSPLKRAAQTAEIIARIIGGAVPVNCPELRSGTTSGAIISLLSKHASQTPLLVVGHIPDLAVFATRLLNEPHILEDSFKPGQMVAIDIETIDSSLGKGRALWWRLLDEWGSVTAAR